MFSFVFDQLFCGLGEKQNGFLPNWVLSIRVMIARFLCSTSSLQVFHCCEI